MRPYGKLGVSVKFHGWEGFLCCLDGIVFDGVRSRFVVLGFVGIWYRSRVGRIGYRRDRG